MRSIFFSQSFVLTIISNLRPLTEELVRIVYSGEKDFGFTTGNCYHDKIFVQKNKQN